MSERLSQGAGRSATFVLPLWLRVGFWACIVVAVAAVLRRAFALAYHPQAPTPRLAALDEVFASHPALTLAHILPALAFVLISPFFILRNSAETAWPDYLLFPLGGAVGVTAYAMSIYSIGGWLERSAVLLFDTLFLFSLLSACWHMRRNELEQKRRWMTRAIAILLGIATTRPVMGIFFATSRLTHLEPQQFFGIAFWIGFSLNAAIVEFWLHAQHRRSTMQEGRTDGNAETRNATAC